MDDRMSVPQCSHAHCPSYDRCVVSVVNSEQLEGSMIVRKVQAPSGTHVFHEGSPQAGATILCTGVARLECRTLDGRVVLLSYCWPGDLLAVPVLGVHACTLRSVQPAWVGVVDRAGFRATVDEHADLRKAVWERLAQVNVLYIRRIVGLASRSARGRLALVVRELLTRGGVNGAQGVMLPLRLSAKDLADMAGCSRQTASTWLYRLEVNGVIARGRKGLRVLRPEALDA